MQNGSRPTIAIAEQALRTSIDTKRESVVMRTISALTIVFLPGTFVRTIFGMAFFNFNEDGTNDLRVNPIWWLYVVITVPLTALIISLRAGWLRRSMRPMKTMDLVGLRFSDFARQESILKTLRHRISTLKTIVCCSSVDEQHQY